MTIVETTRPGDGAVSWDLLLVIGAAAEFAGLSLTGRELWRRTVAHDAPPGLPRRIGRWIRRLFRREGTEAPGSPATGVGNAMPARAVARPGDPGEGASEDEWRSWVRRSLGRLDEDLHAVNERVDGAEREIASSVATAGDHVERSVAELRREQHDEVIANLGLAWLGLYLAAGGVLLSTVASVAG
jgi:hypothetical protein